MKLLCKFSTLAFLFLVSFSCTTDAFENEIASIEEASLILPETKSIETQILELINNHRLSKGLNALQSMAIVKSTAHSHTDYMVDNQVVSHDNFFARSNYLKTNAGAQRVSENVAYGYTNAESVVRAWLNSDGHRETIIGDFTYFDISAEQDVNGKWYFTNIFIKK